MAVEDALVVAEEGENVGESVVVGDEREVVVAMAGEVVNLEVVAGLGRFGQRRGMHRIVGWTPFALQVARVGVHGLSFALGGGIDAGHGGGRRHLFMETGGEGVVEMRALGSGDLEGWRRAARSWRENRASPNAVAWGSRALCGQTAGRGDEAGAEQAVQTRSLGSREQMKRTESWAASRPCGWISGEREERERKPTLAHRSGGVGRRGPHCTCTR